MLWFDPGTVRLLVRCMSLIIGALCLTSCGFRPQLGYVPTEGSFLSLVDIPSIPDQQGQFLHNHLMNRFPPQCDVPLYRFHITLQSSQRGVGIERDSTSSREQILTSATYQLVEGKTKRVVGKGVCRASAYFNLSKTQVFQVVSSEKNASTQSLLQLRDCLISRVSLLLRKEKSHGKF